jgi:hypothetical protein
MPVETRPGRRQLCIAIPNDLAERLEAVAVDEGLTLSAVVRRAALRDVRRIEADNRESVTA